MKSQNFNRRKKMVSRLIAKHFKGDCPYKETLQKPLYKFLIGDEREIIEYKFLLKDILKEFINNTSIKNRIISSCMINDCYEITEMLNRLITLLDDLSDKEQQLTILQEMTSIEKDVYSETGLNSVEQRFLN